jgi:hypothetical protein
MPHQKLELINEQTSPLFRIMWVSNMENLQKRHFDNNISAFHVGNGILLSVAHNVRIENNIVKTIDENIFQSEILSKLNEPQQAFFNQSYIHDPVTGKRHLNLPNQNLLQTINETFRQVGFDTRWLTLAEKKVTAPCLIVQFSNNAFYNNAKLTERFNSNNYFHEPGLNRHTFVIQLELVKAFYSADIAVYRIAENDRDLIEHLPFLEMDFNILDDRQENLYCLQSSPGGVLGRLLNKASIEGFLDHHNIFPDRTGGNYILEGYRYLIRGYFRFGSSGSPYVFYDEENKKFKVNAIQSEASPVQLSINNSREGNYQYVNAIASPLNIVQKEIQDLLA